MKERSEAGFFCHSYVGLRFFLLLAVLEGHYWFEKFPGTRVGALSLSVPCFFALSGFLISHTLFCYESLPRGRALATFYLRRALRILPAYYLVLALAQWWHGVPYLEWHLTYLLNWKVYFLSAWDPGAFVQYLNERDFNAIHLWSVCVEEQFYLLYPLFVLFSPVRWRTHLLLLFLGFCIVARIYLLATSPPLCFFGGLPFVAGEYILWGCLFAWMDFRGRWRWLCSRWALYGSLLGLLGLAWNDSAFARWGQWRPPVHQTVYCLLIATLIASLRYNGGSWPGRLLAWKPFRRIGTWSYGAYLVHSFLNPTLDHLLESFPWLVVFPSCPRAAFGPFLTVAVAALLWHGFEKPIQSWRGRFSGAVVAGEDGHGVDQEAGLAGEGHRADGQLASARLVEGADGKDDLVFEQ